MIKLCEECLRKHIPGLLLAFKAVVVRRESPPLVTEEYPTTIDKKHSKCEQCFHIVNILYIVEPLTEAVEKKLSS